MAPIFRNSSSRAKVLNQSKSSFILLLTLFVSVIVACVMFVNKEALAEESDSGGYQYPSTISVKPDDQKSYLTTQQSTDYTTRGGNFTIQSLYSDSVYSLSVNIPGILNTEGKFTYSDGTNRIVKWNAQATYSSPGKQPVSNFVWAKNDNKTGRFDAVGCGIFPKNVIAYIGTDHYYKQNVDGGSIEIFSGSKSFIPGTFEAAYGSSYGDLSMSISGNYLTYDTGTDGDDVVFLITPDDGYALDKVELRKVSDNTLLATVTPEAGAMNIPEVEDKIVPIFKKLEYIGVSGSVYGNMYEPLAGAEIYDVTDQSNPKLVATTDADGNFNFKSLKGEAHKFSISDPSGTLTPDVFEITEEQATEDVDAGTFYLVDGAEIEIVTSGEGFNGVNVIAEKDGTVYYEGPYEGANIALSEDGELSVNEDGNLVYTYSYTDGDVTHNYVLTFLPNAEEGYHTDSWTINGNTIKFGDESYVITADDVASGLVFEPVMAVNSDNPSEEVNASAQTGDYLVVGLVGLAALIALAGACALRFRKEN